MHKKKITLYFLLVASTLSEHKLFLQVKIIKRLICLTNTMAIVIGISSLLSEIVKFYYDKYFFPVVFMSTLFYFVFVSFDARNI